MFVRTVAKAMLMTRSSMSLVALAVALAAAPACKKPAADAPPAVAEVPVTRLAPEDVVTVADGLLETGPRISGTLEARVQATVRAETGGAVVAVGPELGEAVAKGVLLARIEAKALGSTVTSGQSSVSAAQAGVDVARRNVERTQALVAGGAVAKRELDQVTSALAVAQAQLQGARSQLASSKSQLGDATVRAPIDGVVAVRSVNVGDVVSMGAPLYDIIDPSTMRLSGSVAANDLAMLAPGKLVVFEVRGYPGQKFEGTISRVAPSADPATRQIPLLVDIPNPGGKLIAGLYAEGRVAVTSRQALLIPQAALDTSGDQPSVLRVRDDALERAVVVTGLRDDRAEVIEITDGLVAGDVVVLRQAARLLMPGARVSVVGKSGSAAPTPAPVETPVAPPVAAGSGSAAGR